MSTKQFSDSDRFGCEGCPNSPENLEYMQHSGVSVSGVDGRPKGDPVLEAINEATWSYGYGVDLAVGGYNVSDMHNAKGKRRRCLPSA